MTGHRDPAQLGPTTTATQLEALAASECSVNITHAEMTERLPLLHRDPFDRLLVSQAMADGLTLVTADDRLLAYPVTTLDART